MAWQESLSGNETLVIRSHHSSGNGQVLVEGSPWSRLSIPVKSAAFRGKFLLVGSKELSRGLLVSLSIHCSVGLSIMIESKIAKMSVCSKVLDSGPRGAHDLCFQTWGNFFFFF